MKVGITFAFDPPSEWTEFKQGKALGFSGPQGQELMVSASSIAGEGTKEAHQELLAHLRGNALEAMQETVTDEALRVAQPLQKAVTSTGLELWTLRATTGDGATLFSQAVIVGQVGVMFVTFEAPNVPDVEVAFDWVLNSIHEL